MDTERERESTPDGKNIWSAAPEDNSQRGAVIKIKQNRKPRWQGRRGGGRNAVLLIKGIRENITDIMTNVLGAIQ